LSDCEVLLGVKEVPIEALIPNKKYFFFSHTIKEQPYNKKMLKTIIEKNIQLIDYECLTDDEGKRVIGFGNYAGIVGAHNGLLGYGKKSNTFQLGRACDAKDFEELKAAYRKIKWPNFRTIITGGGRVAKGAIEVMKTTGIREVNPFEFVARKFQEPVWCQLRSHNMYQHRETQSFEKTYYEKPEDFYCDFAPFYSCTDLMINGIYWDPKAPAFFSKKEMRSANFNISVIADVTCDIAPEASIPSTLYASKISEPFFDYNQTTEKEEEPFQQGNILMMSIDNLPNELPRDASKFFGSVLSQRVLPDLHTENSLLINKASICKGGDLTQIYEYLRTYVS